MSSVAAMAFGALLLWRLLDALLSYDAGMHQSSQRLLGVFVALSGAVMVLQPCILRLSASLLEVVAVVRRRQDQSGAAVAALGEAGAGAEPEPPG